MTKHLHLEITFRDGSEETYSANYETIIEEIVNAMRNRIPLVLVSISTNHKIMVNPDTIKTIEFIPFETNN